MSKFQEYLEKVQNLNETHVSPYKNDTDAVKEKWWKKNAERLMDWVDNNNEIAADLYAFNIGCEDDLDCDEMGAWFDNSLKNQALDILYTTPIEALEKEYLIED